MLPLKFELLISSSKTIIIGVTGFPPSPIDQKRESISLLLDSEGEIIFPALIIF